MKSSSVPRPAQVCGAQELTEVAHRPVGGIDAAEVGDVVAVVPKRRGVEGEEPERRDTELLQVVELLDETAEVPGAVAVRVAEGADVELVDDGVLEPELIVPEPAGGCERPADGNGHEK